LLAATTGDREIVLLNHQRLVAFHSFGDRRRELLMEAWEDAWSSPALPKGHAVWRRTWSSEAVRALAVCANAVVAAAAEAVSAYAVEDGIEQWRHELPAPAMPWGLAVDREGRTIVALEDGTVLAYGPIGFAEVNLTRPGGLRLRIVGPPHRRGFVQRSTNLIDWEDWRTVDEFQEAGVELMDAEAPAGSGRFYRLAVSTES
jgi:hypothetical protein